MSIEPRPNSNVASETGGAVLGALVGLAFAGPMGAAGAGVLAAAASPIAERLVAKIQSEWRRRGQVVAGAAAHASGMSQDELAQRMLAVEEIQPLVIRVLDAVTRTGDEEILRLLGGVLGEAVGDRPRRIDEDATLIDSLGGLTAVHVRVMEVLETAADPSDPDKRWSGDAVAERLSEALSSVGVKSAFGGLVARGLVELLTGVIGAGSYYQLTDFGHGLLGALRRAQESEF